MVARVARLTSFVSLAVLCGAAWADPQFSLSVSNDKPLDGSVVTFTLNFNGDGLGLVHCRFDAVLGGTATWDTPTNPQILVPELEVHATATAGLPAATGVDDAILAIDYQSFPWAVPSTGQNDWAPIWSTDVTLHGNAQDTVSVTVTSELDPLPGGAGVHAFFSDGTAIESPTQLAILEFMLPLPGDTNGDWDVDIFDFQDLQNNYGTPSGMTYGDGDFNGDGDVDIFDFQILQNNYGTVMTPPPVPEPVSLTLLVLGTASVLRRRRRVK